jgi:hypothetical protein
MAITTRKIEAQPDPAASPRGADGPTHFVFEHRLFAVKGAMFETTESTGTMCLAVDLGDIVAHVDLDAIANSFGIPADSQDAQMLELVRRALAHVKRIAPGDAIPSEILDGTASWRIEPRHLLLSQGRICASLLAWMGEGHGSALEPSALMRLAADPQAKASLREAFGKLAAHLGLPPARTGEVLGRVGTLAKELAYIEALRERLAAIEGVRATLHQLFRLYRGRHQTAGEIERALKLMAPPLARLTARFDNLDSQTAETANVMPNLPTAIAFIRTARDELRGEFLKWEPTVESWRSVAPVRSERAERAIMQIYGFLARTYPLAKEWTKHE